MSLLEQIRDMNPRGHIEHLLWAQLETLTSEQLTKLVLWAAHHLEQRGKATSGRPA